MNLAVTAGVATGIAVSIAAPAILMRIRENRRAARIKAEVAIEIASIRHAERKVLVNVQQGKYDDLGIDRLLTDFEFEQIAYRIEH